MPGNFEPIPRWEFDQLVARVIALENAQKPSAELAVVEDKPAPRTRGTRLHEGWEPGPSTIEKMEVELGASRSALWREHHKFMDHFLSVPGQRGVKIDWDRAWCNWMRTAAERGNLGVAARRSAVEEKQQGWSELNIGS